MAVITQFAAGVKTVEQNSSVRRWVGIQADPSVNPGVIVVTIVLLTRTLPYFHMFWYPIALGLRKPLLIPTLKPIPCPGISSLDPVSYSSLLRRQADRCTFFAAMYYMVCRHLFSAAFPFCFPTCLSCLMGSYQRWFSRQSPLSLEWYTQKQSWWTISFGGWEWRIVWINSFVSLVVQRIPSAGVWDRFKLSPFNSCEQTRNQLGLLCYQHESNRREKQIFTKLLFVFFCSRCYLLSFSPPYLSAVWMYFLEWLRTRKHSCSLLTKVSQLLEGSMNMQMVKYATHSTFSLPALAQLTKTQGDFSSNLISDSCAFPNIFQSISNHLIALVKELTTFFVLTTSMAALCYLLSTVLTENGPFPTISRVFRSLWIDWSP